MRPAAPNVVALVANVTRALALDVLICLRFYTRLPLPERAFGADALDPRAFGGAFRAAPLAGAVVGMAGAAGLWTFGFLLGLPPAISSILALSLTIACSGALHEDGLADLADGFGGGGTRARKLEIMRDSRIGTYGALALLVSVLVRIGALSALSERHGVGCAGLVLIAAGAASRGIGLLPLAMLRAARPDGLGNAAGSLPRSAFFCALGLAVTLGTVVPMLAGIGGVRALLACAAAAGAGLWLTALARRQIGGQTGDVSGAAQQAAEIAFVLALLVSPRFG